MTISGLCAKVFSWATHVVTGGSIGAVAGVAKDISTAAKVVTGIRKDLVETALASRHLEEKNSLVAKVTFEDILRYGQKIRVIMRQNRN